jgi:hypothetical protein
MKRLTSNRQNQKDDFVAPARKAFRRVAAFFKSSVLTH